MSDTNAGLIFMYTVPWIIVFFIIEKYKEIQLSTFFLLTWSILLVCGMISDILGGVVFFDLWIQLFFVAVSAMWTFYLWGLRMNKKIAKKDKNQG